MKPDSADMALISRLFPYTSPENIPVSYVLDGIRHHGFSNDLCPRTEFRQLTKYLSCYTISADIAENLEMKVEYYQYTDYPVTEWIAYLNNRGNGSSPVVSEWRIFDVDLPADLTEVVHGNGDTCAENGFRRFRDKLPTEQKLTIAPTDGTSCRDASPYIRFTGHDWGVNLAVGWPAAWYAELTKTDEGKTHLNIGQRRFNISLKPGEVLRSPRITLQGYSKDENRARNLWRSFYFDHICPSVGGEKITPKLCLHTWMIEGKPEFTAITEENQINAIDTYCKRGLKPDIWWIDAGWYPCDYVWERTGTWKADPARLPRGLAPVGEKCEEEGIDLLLWFEPERVTRGSELDCKHPEWLLHINDETDANDRLLDLGNDDCCDFVIDRVDRLIKEFHVKVYRQDFNFCPLGYWVKNDGENRIGALENHHVQGYLRYWDALLERNPELLIDSCAGGGRRNDLETMRRAVPLQYTDVGLGNHPLKQLQHREMFEWIPYFRAHNLSWDNENGEYGGTRRRIDEFAYQCALAPAVTSMIEYYDDDELFSLGIRFDKIWREAASLMLKSDYYPLTECRADSRDWYAMQFDDGNRGFIQAIRNIRAAEETIVLHPFVANPNAIYHFTDKLNGKSKVMTGAELTQNGFSVSLPVRSAVLWFYEV